MNKKIISGILISAVMVYLSFRGINFQDTFLHFKNIQLSYVAIFIAFTLLMQTIRSYRWGVILQPLQKIDQLSLFSVTAVGFLAIAAIPARLGELARPYLISKKSSIKMSSALGTIVVERVLDVFSVLIIAVVILMIMDLPSWMIKSSIILLLLMTTMLVCIVGLILRREKALQIINLILNKLPGKFAHNIDDLIHHFTDGFQVIINIKYLLYLFFLSAIIWLLDFAAIYTLLKAFNFALPVIASFVLLVVLVAGITIPTAPGYIGNWHFACILALTEIFPWGITKPEALSFAIVYHFLSMAIVVILGVTFLPFNKFSVSDMKKQVNKNNVNEDSKQQES